MAPNEPLQHGRASIPPKPRILQLNVDNIPAELRILRAWVAWRLGWRKGKWTKEPINPATGYLAKPDDPNTWSDLKTALWRMRCGCDGIGICRTDNYIFIDLDGVLDADGNLLPYPWARKILDAVSDRAYVEKSVTGTGLHIICRGKLPRGRRQLDIGDHTGFAFYDGPRFFTVSGQELLTRTGVVQ